MTLAILYLRSRLAGRAVALLAAIATATWAWTRWMENAAATVTLLTIAMPVAAAAVVGASAGSPVGESETTASRALGPLRIGHLLGLLAIAAALLALAVSLWPVPNGAWTLVRNLTGFTGLALLAAWTLGSGLSWVLPLGYAVLSLFAPTTGQIPEWAWSVQAASDGEAAFIAGVLLLIGLTLIARSGARQRLDDTL